MESLDDHWVIQYCVSMVLLAEIIEFKIFDQFHVNKSHSDNWATNHQLLHQTSINRWSRANIYSLTTVDNSLTHTQHTLNNTCHNSLLSSPVLRWNCHPVIPHSQWRPSWHRFVNSTVKIIQSTQIPHTNSNSQQVFIELSIVECMHHLVNMWNKRHLSA